MMRLALPLVLAFVSCSTPPRPVATRGAETSEVAAWRARAQGITIIRDDWGVPHVHGKTDADVVFGVIYAQAEDAFNRIETNYLNAIGRLAEAEGEAEIFRDLRMKLFIDPAQMKARYESSPDWLKALMEAHADGLNYYLYTHPEVKPRVIARFEPWMPLTFSEGSIGGDIERVDLTQLQAFYGEPSATTPPARPRDPAGQTGSNGFAIAPSNSASGKALLWINPHTSLFFRAEAHMVSEQGLDAYGAITWGQFFVYQGFNARAGWMHTSSSVDNIDEYAETIVSKADGGLAYRYGAGERPVQRSTITVAYRTATGMANRSFTVYRTHHGPVVRKDNGRWISVRLMQEPVKALIQSYSRTKAHDYAAFKRVMDLHANSSNNTVFADADGNIAYFHANFIPRRDPRFDWSKPVDGSDPATEWGPLMTVDDSPNVVNPPNGWIQNTNNWPYSAAGTYSPRRDDYPAYVDAGAENPRGVHAIRLLDGTKRFTLESLRDAAFDRKLTAFETLIPALVQAYDRLPASGRLARKLSGPIAVLRAWDLNWGTDSVATALAVLWGEEVRTKRVEQLDALAAIVDKLTADFGTWQTPWGEINRFQRLTGDIAPTFDDDAPSIPVPFAPGRYGSLASFDARSVDGSRRIYGTGGNSFVAVVEFGDRVRAKAINAGGQSNDPSSPHFNDQAERYASGSLRDVYFYPDELDGHVTRRYHPGE